MGSFLPPLLIAGLARHFGATRVNFVFDVEPEDEDLATIAALPDGTDLTRSVMSSREASLSALAGSMVVDHGGVLHKALGSRSELFDFGTLWVAPDDTVEPPAALRLDSNFYSVSEGGGGLLVLREWYRIKSSLLIGQDFGNWTAQGELSVHVPSMWERRKNLHGITLRTATLPMSYLAFPSGDGYGGMIPEILDNIQYMSNFTVDWLVPEDGKWGAPEADGSWNGMVGMVTRDEADLIATALAVTLERSEVVSYSNSLIKSIATLIIVDPSYIAPQSTMNLLSFLTVFSPSGWVGVLVVLAATYLAYFLLVRTKWGYPVARGVASSLAFTYKSFLKLGISFNTRPLSSKALLVTAMGYSIVVMAYYEGMLTSFMTVEQYSLKFSSFADSIKLGYRVTATEGTKHATDLEGAPPGTGRHEVYQTIKDDPEPYCKSTEACKEAMLDDPRLALAGTSLLFLGDRRFVSLDDLDDAKVDTVAFALQKNSEFLRLFNYDLVKLDHSGILDFVDRKWSDSRQPDDVCKGRTPEEARPLGKENMLLPGLILAGGGVLAILTFVLEVGCRKMSSTKRPYQFTL